MHSGIPHDTPADVVLLDSPNMAQALDRAIALLTDGRAVDWEGVLEDAADARERGLIEELRGLAQLDAETPGFSRVPVDGTLGVSAPGLGSALGRWGAIEIRGHLGRGAYGDVYDGWDTGLAREVALKLLPGESPASMLDEARRLARVRHPHVVTIL